MVLSPKSNTSTVSDASGLFTPSPALKFEKGSRGDESGIKRTKLRNARKGKRVGKLLQLFHVSSGKNMKQCDADFMNQGLKGKHCMEFSPQFNSTTPTPHNSANFDDLRDDPEQIELDRDLTFRTNLLVSSPEVRDEYVREKLEEHKRVRLEATRTKKKLERIEHLEQKRFDTKPADTSLQNKENNSRVSREVKDSVSSKVQKFSVDPAIPEHKRGSVFESPHGKKVRTSSTESMNKHCDVASQSKQITVSVDDSIDKDCSKVSQKEKCIKSDDGSKIEKDQDNFSTPNKYFMVTATCLALVGIGAMCLTRYLKKK